MEVIEHEGPPLHEWSARERAKLDAKQQQAEAERERAAAAVRPAQPPRVALAAAIEAYRQRVRSFEQAKQAEQSAAGELRQAKAAVERAREAIKEAQENAVIYAKQVARGDAGPAPVSIKTAKADLVALEDQLATAEAAMTQLTKEREAAGNSVGYAQSKIERAVAGVLRSDPAIGKLLARYAQAQRELAALAEALDIVAAAGGELPQDWRSSRLGPGGASDLIKVWKAAIAALATDAEAALPL
jgi:chromosome segregation ATPase